MRTALKYAVGVGALGFFLGSVLMALAISDSTSSTAAIGYLFIPFYAAIFWGAPASVAGLCVGYLRARQLAGTPGPKLARVAAWAVLGSMVGAGGIFVGQGLLLSAQVDEAAQLGPAELEQQFDSGFLGKNKFVLGAIAQNRRTPPGLLHKIAQVQDVELHQAMGSAVFNLTGENRKGLAVMRLVARHPNVEADTLLLLATSPDEYVLGDVAANPKLPEAALRKLVDHGGYLIEWGAAGNPKAPPDVLKRLAGSSDATTRQLVAQNPGAPR